MAHTFETSVSPIATLRDRVAALMVDLRARRARRQVYKQTLHELRSLTLRDLSDLGIYPGDLKRIAWEAAYKV